MLGQHRWPVGGPTGAHCVEYFAKWWEGREKAGRGQNLGGGIQAWEGDVDGSRGCYQILSLLLHLKAPHRLLEMAPAIELVEI